MQTMKLEGLHNFELKLDEVIEWKFINTSFDFSFENLFGSYAKSIKQETKTIWNAKTYYALGLEIKIDMKRVFSLSENIRNYEGQEERITNIIPNWAKTRFEDNPENYYHSLEVATYRADNEIRRIEFTKAFIISYKEEFDEHTWSATILLGQKPDMTDRVLINGEAYGMRIPQQPRPIDMLVGTPIVGAGSSERASGGRSGTRVHSDLEVWLVHGTVMPPGVVNLPGAGPRKHWSNEFVEYLANELSISTNNIHIPDWGGALNAVVRSNEGHAIASSINERLTENPNLNIVLIGYSHGGNVSIRAINRLSNHYNINTNNITLITIGTPIRNDYTLNTNINQQINVFNTRDTV
ncbi:MAG: hypothetical protein FWF50_06580, partial [Defluviitaleaceae bacterium]|nr:hypothetical protein [Defluviitaleaceae bacterium]